MKGGSASIVTQVVEAMTTNETFFFRDRIPFDHVRDSIVPGFREARALQKRIRIWCAAASSGQEPYSLAMGFKEMGASLNGWRIDILATDISAEVLEKSSAVCRSSSWSNISRRSEIAGSSRPRSKPWCSFARSTCSTISVRSACSIWCFAATC
jgi:chemotaxis methyl-accepting protein methylase